MGVCMLDILNRWNVYKNIYNMLREFQGEQLLAVIDEGRSKRKKQICKLKKIYRRIFTIESENTFYSFSYSDLICKTITLKIL